MALLVEPNIVLSRIPPTEGPDGTVCVPVGDGSARDGVDEDAGPADFGGRAVGVPVMDADAEVGEVARLLKGDGSVLVLRGLKVDDGAGKGKVGRWVVDEGAAAAAPADADVDDPADAGAKDLSVGDGVGTEEFAVGENCC